MNADEPKRPGLVMAVVAASLALLAPFLNYLSYQRYPLEAPESLLLIGLLIGLGLILGVLARLLGTPGRIVIFSLLLLLFVDIQFSPFQWWGLRVPVTLAGMLLVAWLLRPHLATIVAIAFGTMLVSSLLLPPPDNGAGLIVATAAEPKPAAEARPMADTLPPVVHILLDEHIGLAGFGPDHPQGAALRGELRTFYAGNGFRLFERAYAQHDRSIASIPSLLDLTDYAKSAYAPYVQNGRNHELLRSRYLETLAGRGYRMSIFQSTYLDYCKVAAAAVARCRTYRYDGMDALQTAALPTLDKVALVLSTYGRLSFLVNTTKRAYERLRRRFPAAGALLPAWRIGEDGLGPLPVVPVFEEVDAAAAAAGPGDLVFAHLLLPHYPYILAEDCSIRPDPTDWTRRSEDAQATRGEDMQRRMALYEAQVRCSIKLMRTLFERMRQAGNFDDAIIIVHGDHGSKIEQVQAHLGNDGKLSLRDFLESFSTLAAVKMPGMPAGSDSRMLPMADILKATVAPAGTLVEPAEHHVFLRQHDPSGALKVGLPEFPTYPD